MLGNPNAVYEEQFVNRKSEDGSGLESTGAVTIAADKLIPAKVFVTYDPEREERVKNSLHEVLGAEYQVRTDIEDTDVEKIMAAAKKRYDAKKE